MATKLLEGTFRPSIDGDKIQVTPGFPEPPAKLTRRQRQHWNRLAKHCALWATPGDGLAFYGVVTVFERIQQNHAAQKETDTSGHPLAFKHIIKHTIDATSQPVEVEIVSAEENPLWSQELKLLRELRSFIAITGLSPVDRARVRKPGEAEAPASGIDKFINRKRA